MGAAIQLRRILTLNRTNFRIQHEKNLHDMKLKLDAEDQSKQQLVITKVMPIHLQNADPNAPREKVCDRALTLLRMQLKTGGGFSL